MLLHGTPFSSYVWRGLAQALRSRYDIYVWDMPGFGRSEMSAGQDVSIEAQGEVFADLLRHWRLTSPSVIAHDIGGAVALRAHLLHGCHYQKLALVDPVAVAPWGSGFFRLVREHPDVFSQLPAHLHRALVREYIGSASHLGLRPGTLDRLVEPWLGERGQPAFYRQIAQADQRCTDEIEPLYSTLRLRILICWGEKDAWIPSATAEELASRLHGDTEVRLFRGAGHLVQEDAPAELAVALAEFLHDAG